MRIKFRLFHHGYVIVIRKSCSGNYTYCGGFANALRPRPGEGWIRGNDLYDGKGIWCLPGILCDVLCYEFRMGRWKGSKPLVSRKNPFQVPSC